MTTFFISQPMNGKTDAEINADRQKCAAWLAKAFGSAQIIDSFIERKAPNDCRIPVWCLGESIKALSEADVVVMFGDWRNTRGCLIERQVAQAYGIPVIEFLGGVK